MKAICWGIIGTGRIATTFAKALEELPDARLVAVGSRTADRAEAFARECGASCAHGTYEALMSDPGVDVIYVSTPHPLHRPNTLACLDHGKAVLCEKPMAMNEREAREMVERARREGLFLMEAMWTRCLPVMRQVQWWVDDGMIGDVRMVSAKFGYRAGWNPLERRLNRELGGGALLDVGVYSIAFARQVFGREPVEVVAAAHIGETGVDEQTAMTFKYEGGGLAHLACAVRTNMDSDARICGTEGYIQIPMFWKASSATLHTSTGTATDFSADSGYRFEATQVMDCLRSGRTESALMPLDESVGIARTMDRVRAAIGLRYPTD